MLAAFAPGFPANVQLHLIGHDHDSAGRANSPRWCQMQDPVHQGQRLIDNRPVERDRQHIVRVVPDYFGRGRRGFVSTGDDRSGIDPLKYCHNPAGAGIIKESVQPDRIRIGVR